MFAYLLCVLLMVVCHIIFCLHFIIYVLRDAVIVVLYNICDIKYHDGRSVSQLSVCVVT